MGPWRAPSGRRLPFPRKAPAFAGAALVGWARGGAPRKLVSGAERALASQQGGAGEGGPAGWSSELPTGTCPYLVRAPPPSPRRGMWWVAPPCTEELFLLAAGPLPSCQAPSLAWVWADTCQSGCLLGSGVWAPGVSGQVWLKVGATFLAGAVRRGRTRAGETEPSPLSPLPESCCHSVSLFCCSLGN